MFDLEKCISDRRKQMMEAGIKTPVPLEELESHLREDIERQLESGMNRREAFDFAIQQIGQAEYRRAIGFEPLDDSLAHSKKFAEYAAALAGFLAWGHSPSFAPGL